MAARALRRLSGYMRAAIEMQLLVVRARWFYGRAYGGGLWDWLCIYSDSDCWKYSETEECANGIPMVFILVEWSGHI